MFFCICSVSYSCVAIAGEEKGRRGVPNWKEIDRRGFGP